MRSVHNISPSRQRLAQYLDDARADLGWTWKEFAAAAGITTETLRQVRSGTSEIRTTTSRAIERALGWERGSVQAILGGSEPERAEAGSVVFGVVGSGKSYSIGPSVEHIRPLVGGDDQDEDPVLFLLTPEEHQLLGRLPAVERQRVLDAARAAARATADALLGTGDEE